jgi:hypothetical protein
MAAVVVMVASGQLLGVTPAAAMECPTAGAGQIRVGVVVDGGSGPVGVTCVVLPERSNGLDALVERARVLGRNIPRMDPSSGLLCAIDDVPAFPACGSPNGSGYAYWSYWLGTGSTWTYSSRGPAFRPLRDGDVEGWRFLATGAGDGSEREPRAPVAAGRPPAPTPASPPTEPAPVRPTPTPAGNRPTAPAGDPKSGQGGSPPVGSDRTPSTTSRGVTTTTQPVATTTDAPNVSAPTTSPDTPTAPGEEEPARIVDERAAPPAVVERDRDAGTPTGVIVGGALVAVLGGAGWLLQRRRRGTGDPSERHGSAV